MQPNNRAPIIPGPDNGVIAGADTLHAPWWRRLLQRLTRLAVGPKILLVAGAAIILVGGAVIMYMLLAHPKAAPTVSAPTASSPVSSGGAGLSVTSPKAPSSTTPAPTQTPPKSQLAPHSTSTGTSSSTGQSSGSTGGSTSSGSNSGGSSSGSSSLQTLNCAPSPHACGYPDATNTGVPSGTSLTLYSGDYTASTAGATVNALHITGSLNITADNVTVKNSKIDCVGVGSPSGHDTCVILGGSHDTLIDSEVGGGSSGSSFGNVGSIIYSGGDQTTQNLIQRVNVHHGDDGFRTDGGTTIRDSYVHDLADGLNGSHSDGSQSCGGTYMQFIHNTFIAYNNDGIFLQGGDCGSNVALTLDHVLVDDNLIPNSGDSSYAISVVFGRNITISNNHFGRGWQVAPVGIAQSNTLVQDQTTLTTTTSSNWGLLENIYDDTGAGIGFPGN